MVVDDDELVRGVVARVVAESARVVVAVEGVAPALTALRAGAFDLVITDLRMPEIDGLELVRWLHAERPSTRILVITGFASAADEDEVRALDADLLRKPFGAADLRSAISRALCAGT